MRIDESEKYLRTASKGCDMDLFIPRWRERPDVLNSLPLTHEKWVY